MDELLNKAKRPTLFASEENGFVEVYFTEEELAALIEITNFAQKIYESLCNNNVELNPSLSKRYKNKSATAALLVEKLMVDGDPDRPSDVPMN
jgi:hypothetical protein